MNKFKQILDENYKEEDILDEKSFEFTKAVVKDLELIVKKLKKGTYRFNEITDIKKKIQEIKSFLEG